MFISFWLVCTIIDFCYAKTLDKTYTTSGGIASFYGGYATVANVTALLIQTFLGSKLLNPLGGVIGSAILTVIGKLLKTTG